MYLLDRFFSAARNLAAVSHIFGILCRLHEAFVPACHGKGHRVACFTMYNVEWITKVCPSAVSVLVCSRSAGVAVGVCQKHSMGVRAFAAQSA